jgi:hypothetical protein
MFLNFLQQSLELGCFGFSKAAGASFQFLPLSVESFSLLSNQALLLSQIGLLVGQLLFETLQKFALLLDRFVLLVQPLHLLFLGSQLHLAAGELLGLKGEGLAPILDLFLLAADFLLKLAETLQVGYHLASSFADASYLAVARDLC